MTYTCRLRMKNNTFGHNFLQISVIHFRTEKYADDHYLLNSMKFTT